MHRVAHLRDSLRSDSLRSDGAYEACGVQSRQHGVPWAVVVSLAVSAAAILLVCQSTRRRDDPNDPLFHPF